MKKFIVILVFVALLTFTACSENTPIPYGIWKSEEPRITLFIDPAYAETDEPFRFPGIYIKDGVEMDVFVRISITHGTFFIHNASIPRDTVDFHREAYFDGLYRIEDNRLYYTVGQLWREQTGVDRIVFELVEEVSQ